MFLSHAGGSCVRTASPLQRKQHPATQHDKRCQQQQHDASVLAPLCLEGRTEDLAAVRRNLIMFSFCLDERLVALYPLIGSSLLFYVILVHLYSCRGKKPPRGD